MWMTMMMGCGDYGSDQFNKSDSLRLSGRKLRPLIPRPTATTPNPIPSNKKSSTLPNPSSNCTRIHKANLSTLNANLATMKDESKSDKTTAVPLVTTRWSPTSEQLYALKEMYRRGVRAPTTDQIHQIAAKLCRFGKIEGKNVFYWFQNHKARERQRHRRMLFHTTCQEQPQCLFKSPERKKSRFEIVQTKNNANSSNSSTLSEESVAVSENGTNQRWTHFQKERELQLKPYATPHIHFSPTTTSTETTPEASGINKFDDERREIQTLELFPIRSNDCKVHCINMTEVQRMAAMDPSLAPNRLYEFLPVKEN